MGPEPERPGARGPGSGDPGDRHLPHRDRSMNARRSLRPVHRRLWSAATLLLALALWPTGPLAAQVNGAITGRVTDAISGRGVIGARVRLLGTGQGAATDTAGRFRIREVRPGNWTVVV